MVRRTGEKNEKKVGSIAEVLGRVAREGLVKKMSFA